VNRRGVSGTAGQALHQVLTEASLRRYSTLSR